MILLEGKQITPTIFPDGTSQVWKITMPDWKRTETPTPTPVIEWRFENEAEFMHVAQLKHLIGRAELYLPYLPYGRQDKAISNQTTFALLTFAKLLNSLNFEKVICDDPHSDHAFAINHLEARYPVKEVNRAFATCNSDIVCYPDKGALSKYAEMMNLPCISGAKTRDQLTGQITGYELQGDPAGKSVLIVDDICDGGATFVQLASKLLERGATNVDLFVSHGLFTRGIGPLHATGIRSIFTKEGLIDDSRDSFYGLL